MEGGHQRNYPRWPSSEGWVKMQQIVPTSQGNINIHYVSIKSNDYLKKSPVYGHFRKTAA
ncbi:MAG TPA: hypothetical protein DGS89_02640 [Oscillibacter sp.]|nr:hypothetical protein [Oscillibacter sp.]